MKKLFNNFLYVVFIVLVLALAFSVDFIRFKACRSEGLSFNYCILR